ncbi:autotransporter outer membrane beta-barrel domain-containing protein [Synechococcus phage DSL-LC03]|nr:autotransporter outer membrane beta-barrel domain-containing protein [Synechococcus phage DSL-LC03]
MSTKKVLAAAGALALGLSPTAALSHTNSIGYVGDGSGGVTFWYGSWHYGTTFNEGELKLEGANGNTFAPTITQFTLVEGSTPAGLIPGTNYFTSDGTQLVPYDTNVQTSYTWQGVTFTGLTAGDYTFTYIPLGDPESYCTTCYSTADWMPMDSNILSYTISLSSAILSGDANQNGIPDVQEFGTVVTPPTPTLVNTSLSYLVNASVAAPIFTSNTVITHTSSESDGKQTLNFDAATTVTATTVTTTTTTPVTTHTYSDGSTHVMNGTPVVTTSSSSQSSTSHQYADYFGRIDQLEVLDVIADTTNGFLIHEPITNHKKRFRLFENNRVMKSYNADAYDGFTTIFGGGFEYDLTKGWTAGAHYNDIYTEMEGVDSISHLKRQHVGIFNSFHGRDLALVTNAGGSQDKYDYARTLEYQFGNWGKVEGQQWWVHNRLYVNNSGWFKPFIGHTVRNVKRDAYVETGSVQSARSVEAYNETTHVGEAGLKLETRFGGKKKDVFGISVDGSYGTDNSYGVTAAIDYKEVISIEGSHGDNGGVTSNSVAAKLKFRF